MQIIAKAKEREINEDFKGIWKLSVIKACIQGQQVMTFDEFMNEARVSSTPVDVEVENKKFDMLINADRRRDNG